MIRNNRLKEKLIKRIRDIDNGELLNQISLLVHFEEKFDEIHIMNPGEIEAVKDGIGQIENGQWISHKEVNRRTDGYLKDKIQK